MTATTPSHQWLTSHSLTENMAPTSALPIGATRVVSEMQPLLVDPAQPGSGLYNAVLALLSPPNPDESERYDEEILDRPAVGFIVVYVSDAVRTLQNCTDAVLGMQDRVGHTQQKDDGSVTQPGFARGADRCRRLI